MLIERIAERIRRNGPITFAELQELALYDPTDGFFTAGHGAGRAGRDFVTSPEVGPLFGALVARQLDLTWARLGRPDPFVVVEAGAGRGRCASDVLRAVPACAPALRYVLVERSPVLRHAQRELLTLEPADEVLGPVIAGDDPDEAPRPLPGTGPLVTGIEELPAVAIVDLVVANELLDNLPVRIVERTPPRWSEVRVALDDEGRLCETVVAASDEVAALADEVAAGAQIPAGARLPVPEAAAEWLVRVGRVVPRGEVVLVDYCAPVADLVGRGQDGWLRTYRGHGHGGGALEAPGTQDITCDVPLEHLRAAARRAGFDVATEASQAAWLHGLGLDELVDEGVQVWRDRGGVADLAAIAGRSRATEAAALTDPAGLGEHRVIVLERPVG
jgi:NADH dehydrogenase [ubiquinone] 1 alpha subcomplex assembly factor 7